MIDHFLQYGGPSYIGRMIDQIRPTVRQELQEQGILRAEAHGLKLRADILRLRIDLARALLNTQIVWTIV